MRQLTDEATGPVMQPDRDILFAVLTLRAGLIDSEQLAEAASLRSGGESTPLPELFVRRGWITPEARDEIGREVEASGRDPEGLQSTLATLSDPGLRSLLATLQAPSFHETVAVSGQVASDVETVAHVDVVMADTVEATADGRSVDPAPMTPLPAEAQGLAETRYTFTRLHARGGIGQVWLAREESLGRSVALKQLRPERQDSRLVRERFLEEAKITGQLEHPGIVPIYQLSPSDGEGPPFYTMRFIRGRTLSEAIIAFHRRRADGRAEPLEFPTLLEAFVAVCNAIAYAHSRGVIHRDLKGQNVVLGDFGEAIVLDWGLAKVIGRPEVDVADGGDAEPDPAADAVAVDPEREETLAGQILGTPAYMAPEQAEGRPDAVDSRSDIYSLGAILYELLTNRRPFVTSGITTIELLRRVREDQPERPRSINPSASAALEAVCLRAMAKRPEDRYQSAGDLAQEVRRFLADEPVEAYPEPWLARAGRLARKHRTLVASAAVLLVVSVAGLAVADVLIGRERDEARLQGRVARRAVDDMYTDVAESWLENVSDPLQDRFLRRALARYEGPLTSADEGQAAAAEAPTGPAPDRLDPRQRKILRRALDYYEQFSDLSGGEVPLQLEAARAKRRIGDIHRKLGDVDRARRDYQRALDALDRLASSAPGQPDVRRERALARGKLGALLAILGETDEATRLLRQALDEQASLAKLDPKDPRLALDLARTGRELAELDKLAGRHSEAEASFREAIGRLEALVAEGPDEVEPRRELAASSDGLGVLLMLLGREAEAEKALRRALALQGPLLAEAPTNPGYREGLAKTSNSLGLLLRRTGSIDEASRLLGEALTHYQRLADDFPKRLEYRRSLGRALVNLGLMAQKAGRLAEAEDSYRRAETLYEALAADAPDVPKVRRDLARASGNLGTVLEELGRLPDAEAAYRRALAINEGLVAKFPDVPDYRSSLGATLLNLGRVRQSLGDVQQARESFDRGQAEYEGLVAKHPDRPDYQEGLAEGLSLSAVLLAATQQPERAEKSYRDAVKIFEALRAEDPNSADLRASLATCLNNLAELKPADAEDVDRRAIELYRGLADQFPTVHDYRMKLAIVHNNLGELQAGNGHPDEALASLTRALETLDGFPLEPAADHTRRHLMAYVLTKQAEILMASGKPGEAGARLAKAIENERAALKARRSPAYQQALRQAIALLGRAALEEGRHAEAARVAIDLAEAAPDKPEARREAAALLARCIGLVEGDSQLDDAARDRLARRYGDRAMAQLRVALDAGLKADTLLKPGPDLDALRSREDFRALVDEAQTSSDRTAG
jgi:serine/threonine protein kinase/Tfp pilus assembly protein PilF